MIWSRAASLAALSLAFGCQNESSNGRPRHNDDDRGTFRALLTSEGDEAEENDGEWSEDCEANEAGQSCSYDDGFGTTCTVSLDADENLTSMYCAGEWGSYGCNSEGGEIACTLTFEGESCSETWSADGQAIELGCYEDYDDYYYDDDYYDDFQEECEENEDGSQTCTWDNGDCTGTYSYAADGTYTSYTYECEDYSSTCTYAEDGSFTCTETTGGESCTTQWDANGCVAESDCEGYDDYPCYYYEVSCEETEGGGQQCSYESGDCATSYAIDADGRYTSYSTTCEDYDYACVYAEDGSSSCTQTSSEETCTTTTDASGCITASDCSWNEGFEDWGCGCGPDNF